MCVREGGIGREEVSVCVCSVCVRICRGVGWGIGREESVCVYMCVCAVSAHVCVMSLCMHVCK